MEQAEFPPDAAAMPDLGIYLHVPFCKHACPYCDFYKVELRDYPARMRLDFPARLQRELQLFLATNQELAARTLATVYFGGGTPSTLVPEAVGELVRHFRWAFPSGAKEPEVTLEANPENLTGERSRKWHHAGINRLSIGVQSFLDRDLKLLERLHEPSTIFEAVANARAAGFGNLSLDLMFALPGQSLVEWMENLRQAVELKPEHISFYGLTFHENTPFAKWLSEERLRETDEELQAGMYLRGAAFLEQAGYEHYEISNFARPGFRSRHNRRYWNRRDVLGLGPGAHTNIGARRWANPDDLEKWAAAVDTGKLPTRTVEVLPETQAQEERLFTALRRCEGVYKNGAPDLYEWCVEWLQHAPDEARSWARHNEESFRLTKEGWLRSDAIVAAIIEGRARASERF